MSLRKAAFHADRARRILHSIGSEPYRGGLSAGTGLDAAILVFLFFALYVGVNVLADLYGG